MNNVQPPNTDSPRADRKVYVAPLLQDLDDVNSTKGKSFNASETGITVGPAS